MDGKFQIAAARDALLRVISKFRLRNLKYQKILKRKNKVQLKELKSRLAQATNQESRNLWQQRIRDLKTRQKAEWRLLKYAQAEKRRRAEFDKLELPVNREFRRIPRGMAGWALALRHIKTALLAGRAAAYDRARPIVRVRSYEWFGHEPVWRYLVRYTEKSRIKATRWNGIPVLKLPEDLWIYQEIILSCKPNVIVEIGSLYGGSTLYFANLLDLIGKGAVISVDLDHANFQAKHERIVCITGDCSSPEVYNQVHERTLGKRTMVVHDGDHSEEAVLRDMELYAGLVSTGQYLVIEDGIIDLFNRDRLVLSRKFEKGPLGAIKRFMERYGGEFVIDIERERFGLTCNPQGYLRRVASSDLIP